MKLANYAIAASLSVGLPVRGYSSAGVRQQFLLPAVSKTRDSASPDLM